MNKKQKNLNTRNRDEFYSIAMVAYQLDDMDTISDSTKSYLFEALSFLPRDVVDFLTDEYTFICQDPNDDFAEHWTFDAMAFKKRSTEDESKTGFILINPILWGKRKIQIAFSIAHEVAHAYLGHKKATMEDTEPTVGRAQEVTADDQAVKWLAPHYPKDDLIKLTYSGRGVL